MDKTKAFIFATCGGIALVGVIGFVVLVAYDKPTSAFVILVTGLIGTLLAAGGLGANQIKQNGIVKDIASSVNGNTTKLLDTMFNLFEENKALRSATTSDTTTVPQADLPSEDTISRITTANDKLAAHVDEA